MDGHHHNTRHHDRREEEHSPPPPQVHHTGPASNAPPVYTVNAPNPQVHHTSHTSYSPPPPHVPSHSPAPPAAAAPHHQPHTPAASTTHNTHNELANKPSVRMYCKAEPNFSLTIRDGKVVLAPSKSADPLQHWIKDEKYSTRVKDEEGFPSFALINKATGQAIKHSVGATQPVELSSYNSNKLDESILWTESKDLGDGYHAIRMVSNIRLNVDAFNGDKNHGGVHDGTRIVLWEWKKDSNQRWKIVSYCKFSHLYIKVYVVLIAFLSCWMCRIYSLVFVFVFVFVCVEKETWLLPMLSVWNKRAFAPQLYFLFCINMPASCFVTPSISLCCIVLYLCIYYVLYNETFTPTKLPSVVTRDCIKKKYLQNFDE